ncbi:response regulator [Paenibacillus thermotolerans]|uniref:response regulator n=1 Tax=Paenibacillus thermotolerans TaxID=3027807 RepID=UPI0023674C44|nr:MULTISPECIES: response regulator [unclassified Paenibacillus]
MYKVLLVDDEILDLEGMKTFIPWGELGLEVADAVNNGFAAIKVLEREKVDILVTDVRMPNMSGLELAQKALGMHKDVRVIFVSGYQDFNYVKQALTLNAVSYVLKPMDDKELVDSLTKVREELDKERKTVQAYKQMIPIVKNEYLLQLLEGTYDGHALDVLKNEYGLDGFVWPGQTAVLETDDLSWKLNPYDDKQRREFLVDYFSKVIDSCDANNIRHVCRINKQRLAIFLDRDSDRTALNDFVQLAKISYPFTVTIGIGGEAGRLEELQVSYNQALEALDFKMFHGKGRVIPFHEVRTAGIEDVKSLDIRLDSLFAAMTNYELVQINDELEKLFQLARSLHTQFSIRNFAMFLIMKLDGYLHTLNEDLFKLLDLELQNLDILLQFETIDDIQSWLRRRAFEISEMIHVKKQKKNWRLIHEIIEYVKQRLNENITLRDVADQFSFSPNYLGHLFKEETSKNFSEYVIGLRMEKAAELLKDNKYKIYEVADQVGYRYLPYFSRQFKETFGMTPIEFRRKQ